MKSHLALLGIFILAAAQNATEKLPGFGQTVNVPGAMERFDQDFADGLALDLFSPKNRTLVVNQNTKPLDGKFASGANGETFVAVQNYSYIITMNETANDLIAKIEIPYDPTTLSKMGLQESNTYVGRLADDKMSWVVDDATRNVHRSENNTRIIKMTDIQGEFRLLARQSADAANIFVQYGQGETRTVNMTAGGRQEAEFVDGLRFSAVTPENMRMNVDIRSGVAPESLPAKARSLNSFAWVVNTSNPNAVLNASMKIPINLNMLAAAVPQGSAVVTVGRRALNSSPTTKFAAISVNETIKGQVRSERKANSRLTIPNMKTVDGEYVLLVTSP